MPPPGLLGGSVGQGDVRAVTDPATGIASRVFTPDDDQFIAQGFHAPLGASVGLTLLPGFTYSTSGFNQNFARNVAAQTPALPVVPAHYP
jgi:hypothetical protein